MKNEKIDGRTLKPEELEARRGEAIRLREKGVKNVEVSKIVGLSEQTISTLYSKYKRDGRGCEKLKKRGRAKDTRRKIEEELEQKIIRLLIDKQPDKMESRFVLWTRESVQELIVKNIGIKIPISTIGDYLKRWGIISRGAISKVKEREDMDMEIWRSVEYSKIRSAARRDNGNILWIDHFSISPLTFKITMIYAVTTQRKTMFSLYDGNIDVEKFINFLQRVIDSFEKKVYLIIEDSKLSDSKMVKEWSREHDSEIVIFYYPSPPN